MSRCTEWSQRAVQFELFEKLERWRKLASQKGARPRLVIFDEIERPECASLRQAATQLSVLVQLEPLERTLPSRKLQDRLDLLEKSRGVHGLILPSTIAPHHLETFASYPKLARFDLDRPLEGLGPHNTALSYLARSYGVRLEDRTVALWGSRGHATPVLRLANELHKSGHRVRVDWIGNDGRPPMSRDEDLLWLLSPKPIRLPVGHFRPDLILVDGGPCLFGKSCLFEDQKLLLLERIHGLCAERNSLRGLVDLLRLTSLFCRTLTQAGETRSIARPRVHQRLAQ